MLKFQKKKIQFRVKLYSGNSKLHKICIPKTIQIWFPETPVSRIETKLEDIFKILTLIRGGWQKKVGWIYQFSFFIALHILFITYPLHWRWNQPPALQRCLHLDKAGIMPSDP